MRVILLLILILVHTASLKAANPFINVIYPDSGSSVGAVDSNFIFGSVTPGAGLRINGHQVAVHKDGGFLAYLPLKPGSFVYKIEAIHHGDTLAIDWPINVPRPRRSFGFDSLRMNTSINAGESFSYTAGDLISFSFQGTPGCAAWARIPGIADSIPMAETSPQPQPYWGEAVFGAGAVPDSMKIKGIYTGYKRVGYEKLPDSTRIYYTIKAPDIPGLISYLKDKRTEEVDFDVLGLLRFQGMTARDSSRYFIRINPDDFPLTVLFTDSVQRMRVGPGKGYLSIYQPKGIKALAVGATRDWYRLRLSETQYGWVAKESVRALPKGILPETSYIKSVRLFKDIDFARIEISLSDRHPFRIEETDDRHFSLYLYGVGSDTDWLRYDSDDPDVSFMSWAQPEPDLYELKIELKRPLWGYDISYKGNVLALNVKRPPENIKSLKGKVIVIDPGHSPDPGAEGPTGLTEAEANLNISRRLARRLLDKGAVVVTTRRDSSALALYERPEIAKTVDADLFVSVHNNALPDGVNPFINNGSSVYYYHRHSFGLAEKVYERLLEKTKLPRHGLYYGNLAVNRPTQYPAILVECAFMMIPKQEAMLKDEGFQKKIANSISDGIEDFLKDYARRTKD